MKLKRHLKCTALLSTLCVGMLFPMAVQADQEYETSEVSTYLFDSEHSTEMTLAFKEDLPTIPYIKVTDYLNTVYKANDFAAVKQVDGTYKIGSAASEYYMTVDPNENVVGFNEFTNFITQKPDEADNMAAKFMQSNGGGYKDGEKPATYDLGAYDIDILEINGETYIPLATMNDMFKEIYNSAQYLNGNLYFLHTSDLVLGSCYYDRSSVYDRVERSAEEAEFNYNELCFMMDNTYGAPTRSKLQEKVLEVGFDEALESSEKLQKAKTYLQSESLVDYVFGLYYIGDDLFDGGHMTPITDINLAFAKCPDSALVQAIMVAINDPERADDKAVCGAYEELCGVRNQVVAQVMQEKADYLRYQYTPVMSWEECGSYLYIAGDTAFFTFDQFILPVVDVFKWSVDFAAAAGMKNFVVDLSTNSGGITDVAGYMLTLMANKERQSNEFNFYNYYRASDELAYQTALYDLNLDGEFNEADKEFCYDLNFAILETRCAFSSGNLMPVRAKEMGIAVLGENSGGGGCALLIDFTESGYYMTISGMPKFRGENEDTDVDLGAAPDYELAYNVMFDSTLLSTKIHEFYGDCKNEWVNGKWYDKDGKQTYAGTASWKKSSKGWWYGDDLGWEAKNQWQKIDGKYYFFDKDGYMEADAYRQGYYLKANGAWDGKAKVAGWKQDSKGWWYSLGGSDFLKNGWKKIDGNWYYFKATGYIAINEFVQGWWVGKTGAWKDSVRYSWHKSGSKWWYGTKDGWYAKSKSYTIDGKTYTFDKKGYTK